jgi:hypothetical protein
MFLGGFPVSIGLQLSSNVQVVVKQLVRLVVANQTDELIVVLGGAVHFDGQIDQLGGDVELLGIPQTAGLHQRLTFVREKSFHFGRR